MSPIADSVLIGPGRSSPRIGFSMSSCLGWRNHHGIPIGGGVSRLGATSSSAYGLGWHSAAADGVQIDYITTTTPQPSQRRRSPSCTHRLVCETVRRVVTESATPWWSWWRCWRRCRFVCICALVLSRSQSTRDISSFQWAEVSKCIFFHLEESLVLKCSAVEWEARLLN